MPALFLRCALACLWLGVSFIPLNCHRADKAAREGLFKLEEGKDVIALTLFEDALEIDPENSLALYGKGQILIRQEVTKHIGLSMLRKAISGLPDMDSRKKAYLFMVKASDAEEGIKILEKMIKDKMDDSNVYSQLAARQLKLKNKRIAVKTYLEAIQKYPQKTHLKGELASLYASHMRAYRKALEYYQKALDEDGANTSYLMGLAKVRYTMGERKTPLEIIQRMLDIETQAAKKNELRQVENDILRSRWKPTF